MSAAPTPRAGIGPAIRQQSYEVGPEFPAQFPAAADRFRPARRAGHFQFDLPGHVGALLARLPVWVPAIIITGAGVPPPPRRPVT